MNLYHQNYIKLLQLLPGLDDMNGPAKLTALGYTDVHVDVIERHKHRLVLRMRCSLIACTAKREDDL